MTTARRLRIVPFTGTMFQSSRVAESTPMHETNLPVIDLGHDDRAPEQIREACRSVGFFYVRNHGVTPETIRNAQEAAAAFFAQPAEAKEQVRAVEHRGYIAMGAAQMEGAKHPDVKESFVVGREPDVDEAGLPMRGVNRWPDHPDAFHPAIQQYLDSVATAGDRVLELLARSLDLDPAFFKARYQRPLMRTNIIRYPPQQRSPEDTDEFGVAAHTDFGCLTLLWQDETGGLEVRNPSTGEWMTATPIPGTFVVNIGDLMERWSNGRFSSTLHRVINRSGGERYAMATFFDPDFNAVADPRDLLPEEEARYEPVGVGDYILGRVKKAFDYQTADS